MKRKIFSILLSLALVVSMIPAFTVPAQADEETIAHIGNTVVYRSDLDKDGIVSGDGWELQTDNTPHPGGYYKSQYFTLHLNNYSGGPIIITGQDLFDIKIVAEGDNYIRGNGIDDGIIASPMNSSYCSMNFYVKAGSTIKIDNVFNGIHMVHPNSSVFLYGQDCQTSQIKINSKGYGIRIHKGWDTSIVEDMEYKGRMTFDNILLDAYGSNQCLAVYQIQVAKGECASILLHGKTDNSFWFDPNLMRMAVGDFGSTHLEIRPIEYHPYQPDNHTISVTNGNANQSDAKPGETITLTYNDASIQPLFSHLYHLDRWTVKSGGVTLSSTTTETPTFTMGNQDVSIEASSKLKDPFKNIFDTGAGDPPSYKNMTGPFVDVNKASNYYEPIMWAYHATPQVTNGMDATHFGPERTVTRGQCAAFLWRAMGEPEPKSTNNPFKDVPTWQYYYKPILWAVENGITNGTAPGKFSPDDTLSTQHIITFLYRTLNPGKDGWNGDAAKWAADGNGKPFGVDLKVNNTTNCPRGAVVTFLYECVGKVRSVNKMDESHLYLCAESVLTDNSGVHHMFGSVRCGSIRVGEKYSLRSVDEKTGEATEKIVTVKALKTNNGRSISYAYSGKSQIDVVFEENAAVKKGDVLINNFTGSNHKETVKGTYVGTLELNSKRRYPVTKSNIFQYAYWGMQTRGFFQDLNGGDIQPNTTRTGVKLETEVPMTWMVGQTIDVKGPDVIGKFTITGVWVKGK